MLKTQSLYLISTFLLCFIHNMISPDFSDRVSLQLLMWSSVPSLLTALLACLTSHSLVLTAERSSNLSTLTTRVDRKIAKQKNKPSLFYYAYYQKVFINLGY